MADGRQAVALGPVVHNATALERLEAAGLHQRAELPDGDGQRVVVTAHGATPALFTEAGRRGLEVVDTTCPLVRRVQRHAAAFHAEGWPVVIVGHARHAEVQGVLGWAGGDAEIVSSEADAERLPWRPRRALVCQSTFPQPEFRRIATQVAARSGEVRHKDTTCPVVNQRQREGGQGFFDAADVILVVGGRDSANTQALAAAAAARRPTHHIQTADEIRPEWFRPGQRIGITSGTSTPDWVVDAVEARCRAL